MALSAEAGLGRDDLQDAARPMKIMVVGLRGIVDVQGGIETHARKLYPLLSKLGCEVEVVQRSPYFPRGRRRRRWRGIRLTYIWSPTRPGLETAVHSLLAVLYAAVKRPDVLHLHAIGPGLLAPVARLLGLRVVLTHHAMDYEREKWGRLAKRVLQAGERLGVRYAHSPIAVSPVIKESLEQRFRADAEVIPNGAPIVVRAWTRRALERFDLTPGRYVLCVARLEPTKRQIDLVDAFRRAQMPGWKLAIVGSLEPRDAYCDALESRIDGDPRVVLTGYQSGTSLRELYTHAGLFVLPSLLEGHPIALLEALSYGLPVIASANSANLAVPLPRDRYFPVGDVDALERMLSSAARRTHEDETLWDGLRDRVRREYSWRRAALLTKAAYERAVRARRPEPETS